MHFKPYYYLLNKSPNSIWHIDLI
uniref:Uncharacterized protein n=1 Tax=Arundo donax TaxID=35708 RepID=A0A0A8ZE21_ARUDO